MIIIVLIVFGLCLGSFVNALVWRLHEQSKHLKKTSKKQMDKLSILHGRSMCPHCSCPLQAADLIPVISWLRLRGKCRYCHKPISPQYPLVELLTAALFVGSYIWWPEAFGGAQTVVFALWLVFLTGLMALVVYDLKWFLLPNRIVYPLYYVAGLMALIEIFTADHPVTAIINVILAVLVGGGIFYVLFQVSKGKWIGGGDVKLGALLGLVVGTPARSVLFIFAASVLGTLISIPLLSTNRLQRGSTIPFGPLLVVGGIIAQLFGADIVHWYQHAFIGYY